MRQRCRATMLSLPSPYRPIHTACIWVASLICGPALEKLLRVSPAPLFERFPADPRQPRPRLSPNGARLQKLIRAASYEAFVLKGGKVAPGAERDYLALAGSIRADIATLWVMAKDGGAPDPVPDLQTYLASLKKVGPKGEDA